MRARKEIIKKAGTGSCPVYCCAAHFWQACCQRRCMRILPRWKSILQILFRRTKRQTVPQTRDQTGGRIVPQRYRMIPPRQIRKLRQKNPLREKRMLQTGRKIRNPNSLRMRPDRLLPEMMQKRKLRNHQRRRRLHRRMRAGMQRNLKKVRCS